MPLEEVNDFVGELSDHNSQELLKYMYLRVSVWVRGVEAGDKVRR